MASQLGYSWAEAKPRLIQKKSLLAGADMDPKLPPPEILTGPEKRRATPVTRLALKVAWDAVQSSGYPADQLHSIFTSAIGDGLTEGKLLQTLGTTPNHLSPVQFHNSVHNATVGYWSIATKAQTPATSLAAGPYSFAVGLMKAALEVCQTGAPGLLVAYDMPFTEPLNQLHPVNGIFGVAMVLSPPSNDDRIGGDMAARTLSVTQMPADITLSPCRHSGLQDMFAGNNSAAKSLPLLEALAEPQANLISLPLSKGLALQIELGPA